MRYIVLLAVILLSGCASTADIGSICPKTGFLDNTRTITYLAPELKKDNVVAVATIQGLSGDCKFRDKDCNMLDVSLTLPFAAQKGTAGGDLKDKELPYFIAVLSPGEEILQRQAFSTKIDFDNAGTGSNTEEHIVRIPLKVRDDADKYKVIIGFALTRDQLKYNEDHK